RSCGCSSRLAEPRTGCRLRPGVARPRAGLRRSADDDGTAADAAQLAVRAVHPEFDLVLARFAGGHLASQHDLVAAEDGARGLEFDAAARLQERLRAVAEFHHLAAEGH